MKKINYLIGDATDPVPDPNGWSRAIIHVVNNRPAWGKGFVLSVSKRWKLPEAAYYLWASSGVRGGGAAGADPGDQFCLGGIQPVRVAEKLWVINMLAQHDLSEINGVPQIRYRALAEALDRVQTFAYFNEIGSLHAPRIGAGLAGGDWNKIEALLQERIWESRMRIFIYDLPTGNCRATPGRV